MTQNYFLFLLPWDYNVLMDSWGPLLKAPLEPPCFMASVPLHYVWLVKQLRSLIDEYVELQWRECDEKGWDVSFVVDRHRDVENMLEDVKSELHGKNTLRTLYRSVSRNNYERLYYEAVVLVVTTVDFLQKFWEPRFNIYQTNVRELLKCLFSDVDYPDWK